MLYLIENNIFMKRNHLCIENFFVIVQCNTNPCQLGGYFNPPNYNCIQLLNEPNVICTCPNGQGRKNTPCRVCDHVHCGPNGVCIEADWFPNSFYACSCTTGTYNYVTSEPCSGITPTATPTTTTPTTTTVTPTTTVSSTLVPIHCLNGGVYNVATATCICQTGFAGFQCETSIGMVFFFSFVINIVCIGQELCRKITCVNGGVCNPVPTANNGIEAQCWCLNGFSGSNCELIGTQGGCHSNLCQNGGVCEERKLGASLFAYCQCPPGFSGRYCERHYFTCSHSGLFEDSVNCRFGRYFQCVDTVAIIRSCSRGFRFNSIKMQCDANGSCP
ncbi:unnamed protein product [Rotaria sp. Silwood1]|nr:unnamed protein product [Rotaria sp. Silwood1]CAF1440380.1 unnamed protein product [Rotaria sp. Silwood1]CAF3722707.1 unnamed protein product [Rotaria sp. Silwood1]